MRTLQRRTSDKRRREYPYTVASAHEFELVSQVIARTGIEPLMSKKISLNIVGGAYGLLCREHSRSTRRQ